MEASLATWAPQRATTETKKVLYKRRKATGKGDAAKKNKLNKFYCLSDNTAASLGDMDVNTTTDGQFTA